MAKKSSGKKPSGMKSRAKVQSRQPEPCELGRLQRAAQAGQNYCGNHLRVVMGVLGGAGHTHGR